MDTILAATAELVAQEGAAAVSIPAVARRARTSIGSMYHFFPDRESLLNALAERHLHHIRALNQQVAAIPAADWQGVPAATAVQRLVTPFAEHLHAHPDFLPLMHGRTDAREDGDFIRGIRCMLAARLPHVDAARLDDYAAVFHALAAGGMRVGYERAPDRSPLYLQEIQRALAAYLTAIEQAEPSPARP